MENAIHIGFYLVALLVSAMIHEQMHARSAYWMGDPTGKNMNRFSWNPIHHIDPFMTILLPAMLLITSHGRFVFGGAKPVQINPNNFRNPALGMCISAAFGPLTNLFLALLGFGLMAALFSLAPTTLYQGIEDVTRDGDKIMIYHLTFNGLFLFIFVLTNIMLGSFNLLPLPWLDGSRVLRYFLPREGRAFMDSLEPYAMLITMGAVYFGAGRAIEPVMALFSRICLSTFGADFLKAAAKALNS